MSVTLFVYSQSYEEPILVTEDEMPQWRHWNSDNGLNKDWVNTITKSSVGNIFINQGNTALLYDGYHFESFPSPEGYRNFYQNRDGQYFADDEKGLLVYEGGRWVVHDLNLKNYDPIYYKYSIISYHKNEFYVLTKDAIYFYDGLRRSKTIIKSATDSLLQTFHSMNLRQDGYVWILGEKGAARVDLTNGKWNEQEKWDYYLFPDEIEYVKMHRFFDYSKSELVVTLETKDKDLRYFMHLKDGVWKQQFFGRFSLGWLGPDDSFWLIVMHEDRSQFSLLYFDGQQWSKIEPSKFNKTVYSLISDQKDSFWICNNHGLTRFCAPLWRSAPTPPELKNAGTFISSLKDSDDALWLATTSNLYKQEENQWLKFSLPERDDIGILSPGCLLDAPGNSVYVRGYRELYEFDAQRNLFRSITPSRLESFITPFLGYSLSLPDHSILFGIFDGINKNSYLERLEQGEFSTICDFSNEIDDSLIDSIIQIGDNDYWVLIKNQIFSIKDGVLTKPRINEEIRDFVKHGLFHTNDGKIWIVCENAILIYDGNAIKKIAADGVDRADSFYEDRGKGVYFSTNKGVYRFYENDLVPNTIEDGLFDDSSNFLIEMKDHNLLTGSSLGLRIHNPSVDIDPPITIYPEKKNLNVFVTGSLVRIQFEGRDRWNYTDKSRLLYSYKLNDSLWSSFDAQPEVLFEDLSAGNYRLQVRSIDRNLNMELEPAIFNFRVNPVWYLEPAFIAWSLMMSFVTLLLAYYAGRNYFYLRKSLVETRRSMILLERTQSRLSNAKQKAEFATTAKDKFLARMSHEIRTPLNGVCGNLELLKQTTTETKLNDKEKRLFHTMQVSALSLLDIIGDVLDMAKINANQMEIENQECSIQKIIEEVLSINSYRAIDQNNTLDAFITKNTPNEINADPVRLRQVLVNLVGNSIKFTKNGWVIVVCDSEWIGHKPASIQFTVMDTGEGFDSSQSNRLFDEFTQDAASMNKSSGTGLGLPICKRIVELMSGNISCDGRKGCGATFHFSVPVDVVSLEKKETKSIARKIVYVVDEDFKPINAFPIDALCSRFDVTVLSLDEFLNEDVSLYDCIVVSSNRVYEDWLEISKNLKLCNAMKLLLSDQSSLFIPNQALKLGFHLPLLLPVDYDYFESVILSERLDVRSVGGKKESAISFDHIKQHLKAISDNIKVLVVDDVLSNRLLVESQFGELGIHCELAENGRIAQEKVKNNQYDIIYVDCSMPELDGFEFTKWYRSSEILIDRSTPIIALTAHVSSGVKEQCIEAGMDDYLAKPIHIMQLCDSLIQWLKITANSDLAENVKVVEKSIINKLKEQLGTSDSETVKDIVDDFLNQAKRLIELIQRNFEKNNFLDARTSLSELIVIAESMGIAEIVDLCRELDERLKMESSQESNELVQMIKNELTRLNQEITNLFS